MFPSSRYIYDICKETSLLNHCFQWAARKDVVTSRNLELLVNLRDPHSQHTLFGVLNFTKTPPGARLLRSSILQPPSSE